MSQFKYLALALLFIGCTSSDNKTTGPYSMTSRSTIVQDGDVYLMNVYGHDMSDYTEKEYTRLYLIDFDKCTLSNGCIFTQKDSSGAIYNYTILRNDPGIFIQDSVYQNRMRVAAFKTIWESKRVPLTFTSTAQINASLYLRVFDEKPMCLNIEQSEGQAHVPCMPYVYESSLHRK